MRFWRKLEEEASFAPFRRYGRSHKPLLLRGLVGASPKIVKSKKADLQPNDQTEVGCDFATVQLQVST